MANATRKTTNKNSKFIAILVVIIIVFVSGSFLPPDFFKASYRSGKTLADASAAATAQGIKSLAKDEKPIEPLVTHVNTPQQVKGLYMSSWVGGSQSIRNRLVSLMDTTELNAVVLDIKDSTGVIAFDMVDASVNGEGCVEQRIRDIESFIEELHAKNIYVIGRIAVFQDPCFVKKNPEYGVKKANGIDIWKDHKGLTWLDAGSKEVWDYNVKIAKAGHAIGFDEINFDYIRFPSDGNLKDISFPQSGTKSKPLIIRDFFAYLDEQLHTPSYASKTTTIEIPVNATTTKSVTRIISKISTDATDKKNIIFSADLFGLVTTSADDLGIGQVLEYALPYVDYVAPMVYPSHFAKNTIGLANPAEYPYEIIKYSMGTSVKRAKAIGQDIKKLRPWLQDFDLGATYDVAKVRAQIKATYDVGLDSWLMWDAGNKYTPSAYLNQ